MFQYTIWDYIYVYMYVCMYVSIVFQNIALQSLDTSLTNIFKILYLLYVAFLINLHVLFLCRCYHLEYLSSEPIIAFTF